MKYNTILLDVDDTLFDFHKCEKIAFKTTFSNYNLKYSDEIYENYKKINDDLWKEFNLGNIEKAELLLKRFDKLKKLYDLSYINENINKNYLENLGETVCLIDGAEDFVKKLYGKYPLYIVTNGVAKTQHNKINKSPIGKYIKEIFTSEEIGFGKPHKEYFDFVCEKALINDKTKVLVIGDSLTSDIIGANNYGFDSLWFNYFKKVNDIDIIPTYTAKSYDEILNFL